MKDSKRIVMSVDLIPCEMLGVRSKLAGVVVLQGKSRRVEIWYYILSEDS